MIIAEMKKELIKNELVPGLTGLPRHPRSRVSADTWRPHFNKALKYNKGAIWT